MFYKPYNIYIYLLRRKHDPDQADPLQPGCSGTRYKTLASVSHQDWKDRTCPGTPMLPHSAATLSLNISKLVLKGKR